MIFLEEEKKIDFCVMRLKFLISEQLRLSAKSVTYRFNLKTVYNTRTLGRPPRLTKLYYILNKELLKTQPYCRLKVK